MSNSPRYDETSLDQNTGDEPSFLTCLKAYWAELSEGCGNDDACMGGTDLEGEGKQVLVGICAMAKKSQSKPMKEILTRLEEFEYIKIVVFPEEVILKESVEDWPIVDCLISFHSKGFPLDKAINYADLRNPFIINNLPMQYDIQDRRRVYAILESEGIEIPRYAVLDRDSADPKQPFPDHELVESEDHVEVNGVIFNKPFVEKPVSAEDHNIYIYYPTSAGGGSQRLFRKIGSRSSVYSPESRVRKTGSYIYEDFMPTDGTDVKVYTVGPDYAHAEARKSPALDGKVERDSEGKEIRYPVILSNAEKLISRKVCLAFKQTVCGFDLLRANGQSFVCDVNGFSFVKNSNKYYDDCAKILGNMILRELAPTLHIPWSVPFQLDDPPIVPTTFGKMMELRCVVAVIRHGDRTPKQKMKVEVRHPKFFEIFAKYDGYKHGHVKLKRPKQLQEILDTARSLLAEIQHRAAGPELEEKQGKLEQLKSVLEMYGHFSGINRKVQMKYQPRGRPRGSSSDDGNNHNRLGEPSLVLILKWGGELTPAGRIQAEELGRIFRCMYPGGQGRHLSEEDTEMLPNHGEYAGAQGLGLLRLHSTFRHDLKIYASDEGRVQMTAAAFAKGLLALEGELTPILVQMVKSANTNGLLDNDCDSSKYQNMVKTRLHELLQQDREFTREDREQINPGNALSINAAMDFVKNPVKCCQHVHALIQKLMDIVRIKKDDPKTKDAILYHGETWELMGRRWGKIEKDFCTKNKRFDISKIPDIYDCIKYDLQHNNHTLQFDHAEELYIYAKYLADIVIPQEYGLTVQEKLTIGQGICTPLLKKIRADLQRNIEESGEETVNRLNPRYSHGVSSPGRHVRTRLYFTSESHVHSLLTVLRYGGLLDVVKDEQWRRAMEYVSMVSELNYMSQIVVMLYEDPTKDPSSEERFHVELHFSPGVNCCVQKNLPPGPGFRPHSRNESSHNMGESGGSGQDSVSQCSTRIEEEDTELSILEDEINPQIQTETSPTVGNDVVDSTLDSPTTSRGIDMMDLDPNMMDEPYDSGFLQSSAPIPIRHVMRIINSRTVAGHEAARLGSQLAASQRQRREREASVMVEPRARSYDHQHQEKAEKAADKLQYQSLDAVNKEEKTEHSNYYKNTLNVPVYLGQPIALPHSISSPELPIPCVQTSIPISPPLITVHDIPLASPINYNYKKNTSAPSPPKDLLMSDLDSYHLSSVNQEQLKNKKTHGGFHTEIILPNIKVDDTRPSIIQPDPTCTARRHRHSISGQMSYFKLLGYNVSKKLTGSANSLFSTAVISGSSSAPNLKDMIPSHAMIPQHVAAIEGFGGVPPIRPLETLHNALSLRQLDSFLEMMTSAPLFRTPASSPPKYPSPGGSVNPNLNVGGISREYQSSDLEAVRYCKKLNNVPLYITPTPIQYKSCGDGDTCDIRNQPSPTSPNSTGWSSEPQSFLSSEPSSPAPTSTGECSMSISLISNDGAPSYSGAPKFPTTPGLDLDFNDFCMNIDQENHEGRGSVSYTDYYSNEDGQIRKGPSYTSTTQKTVVSSDDLPVDTVDDDEEHTLTLRQTEAQKKQDVKLLFEQVENPNATKSTVGYKKIGRFRVESMEISDDDVRIKEPSSACSSTDKNKLLTLQKMETTNAERGPTHRNKETRHKRKNFSRSQSVSTPKTFVAKSDTNFSFKSVKSKESSFSAMTDKDLEKWKLSSTKSDPSTSCTETQKEPILTMASSLTDSPSVTIGFDIQDKKNE
ncbi:inositol hexakisphosphate and diphosphoinositol-pentakisphosphate kinase 2-like isoform X15 [Vespa mandarinia]|uniref:inositol hexakisphosphate and diphosphoinositol-pentakisphosphate kinase 2-like isoform X15 n=1 Tax=Vespa mandarinia TaxID=7446 RepID=UPI001612525C|nr:inositol hexakisphosphate and diphosphoinositol-pentakisphosphate kinase 2-like isoform X15 [Vespa mandarinia]XP_035718730.1 inositol hexakisphosphate and diphosphoinositol-pentakisphosphate kinase 2-like isoform X15 [Vespa mandarinia]XP_035718731.1 inositol hexakisphosphate and diphosphoinositol-pentakisphosphate kinase 2-like isoform X15 [Vespa mandarinia]